MTRPGDISRNRHPTPVVTVFLANGGKILLARRSRSVGTYAGAWAGVSGHVERLPIRQAYVEMWEEVGLSQEDVQLAGIGVPMIVEDAALKRVWLIHLFLFNVEHPEKMETNWEIEETRWVTPEELASMRTVPGLGHALDSVWPSVGDRAFWEELALVAEDTVHGATSLAIAGLNALEAYFRRDPTAPRERAICALAACRTSMGVFPHLAARLLTGRDSASELAGELARATTDSAARAAEALTGMSTILTTSYSSAVRDAILMRNRAGKPLKVIVCESRPGLEGVTLAEDLAIEGLDVTVITDAQANLFVPESDAVLAGCDAITDANELQNKAGTSLLALAARSHGIPCFAVAQTFKIIPAGFPHAMEEQEPEAVGSSEKVRFRNLIFEPTPMEMFDAVYAEIGALTPETIAQVRSRLGRWGG